MPFNPRTAVHAVADLNRFDITTRLGSRRADILYFGALGEKWWRNYLHTHSFYEACYVFAGKGIFRIDDHGHPVRAGDLFVARPQQPHEIISRRGQPLKICFWANTLVPSPSSSNQSPADVAIDAAVENFISSRAAVTRASNAIPATIELLLAESLQKSPGYTTAIHDLSRKLLLDTIRSAGRATPAEQALPKSRTSGEFIAETIRRYLQDNLARPLQIRDIAAQVHLSERHVNRLFNEVTGKTLLDYLTDLRLQAAAQLLLDRHAPIKSIARQVGYPDVRYFTTLFHRRTGTTPAIFRKKGGTTFLKRRRPRKSTA